MNEIKDYPASKVSPLIISPRNFQTDSDLVSSIIDLKSPEIFKQLGSDPIEIEYLEHNCSVVLPSPTSAKEYFSDNSCKRNYKSDFSMEGDNSETTTSIPFVSVLSNQ